MSARDDLVTALATVPGISALTTSPDAPVAGSAWPRWVQTRYVGGKLHLIAVNDYDVYAVLPNGAEAATVEQGDGLLPMLAAALLPVAAIDFAEPVSIQFDEGQTMPGIRIRLTPKNC